VSIFACSLYLCIVFLKESQDSSVVHVGHPVRFLVLFEGRQIRLSLDRLDNVLGEADGFELQARISKKNHD
jgi:hypothetical protein